MVCFGDRTYNGEYYWTSFFLFFEISIVLFSFWWNFEIRFCCLLSIDRHLSRKEKLTPVFYADPYTDMILADGITLLCNDLQVAFYILWDLLSDFLWSIYFTVLLFHRYIKSFAFENMNNTKEPSSDRWIPKISLWYVRQPEVQFLL